jgi:TonB family protein
MKSLILVIALFQFTNGISQQIINTNFHQIDKKIIVTYDFINTKADQTFYISLYVSTDNGNTWQGPLEQVSGDIGKELKGGYDKSIVWNALEEFAALKGKIGFRVIAKGNIKSNYAGYIYTFDNVKEVARFPSCENDNLSISERNACSLTKLFKYIYSNLEYPEVARNYGIEGRVHISFVVEKDGFITTPRIIRGVGSGLDKEVLRIVKSMNEMPERWIPGKNEEGIQRTEYILSIRFRLE